MCNSAEAEPKCIGEIMINKDELYRVSLEYLNLPHINGAMVKGVAVDCCTLPALIYKDLGVADIKINFGYSADWFCRRNCEEILLPYLNKYFKRVDTLAPGDLITFSWGRAEYAHAAIYLGNDVCVHAQADAGVEIIDLNHPCFFDGKGKSRMSGIWRLKNEFI